MAALKLPTLVNRFLKQQEVVQLKARDVTRAEAARDKEKAKLEKIGNEILDRFSKEEINGLTTDKAVATIKPLTSPSLKNWNALITYIKKTNGFELFQRRVNKAAWLEHLEARKGRPVPGVAKFERNVLSVTAKKGK